MTKFHCVDVTMNVSRRDDNETHCDVSKLYRHHFSHRYVNLMDGTEYNVTTKFPIGLHSKFRGPVSPSDTACRRIGMVYPWGRYPVTMGIG